MYTLRFWISKVIFSKSRNVRLHISLSLRSHIVGVQPHHALVFKSATYDSFCQISHLGHRIGVSVFLFWQYFYSGFHCQYSKFAMLSSMIKWSIMHMRIILQPSNLEIFDDETISMKDLPKHMIDETKLGYIILTIYFTRVGSKPNVVTLWETVIMIFH